MFVNCVAAGMFSEDINSRELWFWCGMVFGAARLVTLTSAETPNAPLYRPYLSDVPHTIGLATRQ